MFCGRSSLDVNKNFTMKPHLNLNTTSPQPHIKLNSTSTQTHYNLTSTSIHRKPDHRQHLAPSPEFSFQIPFFSLSLHSSLSSQSISLGSNQRWIPWFVTVSQCQLSLSVSQTAELTADKSLFHCRGGEERWRGGEVERKRGLPQTKRRTVPWSPPLFFRHT